MTSPESRSAAIASRSVLRETPEPLGEVALGRQLLADDEDPEPDGRRQLLDGGLEDVADRGAEHGVRQPGGLRRRLLRSHGCHYAVKMVRG